MTERDGKATGWKAFYQGGQWVSEGSGKATKSASPLPKRRALAQRQKLSHIGLHPNEPSQAFANHSMYMASIVLDVWGQSERDGAISPTR